MTNYEKVKQKIIEAVPEIMELKFGCEVIVKGIRQDNPGCENDIVIDERKLNDGYIGLGYYGRIPREGIEEILGREIRFSDVLRAIGETKRMFVVMTHTGEFFECVGTEWIPVRTNWDLSHDSLSWHRDNRPEVIEFLAEILTK